MGIKSKLAIINFQAIMIVSWSEKIDDEFWAPLQEITEIRKGCLTIHSKRGHIFTIFLQTLNKNGISMFLHIVMII